MRRISPRLWLAAALVWLAGPAAADAACHRMTFEGDGFSVCAYTPVSGELRLLSRTAKGPIGSLPALKRILGADAKRVAFAMNAGMYEPGGQPVGLWIEDGVVRRPAMTGEGAGNFYMKPNGVFWVRADGAPHVTETRAWLALADQETKWATQSGPLLVAGGRIHPAIWPNGESRTVRNGVGVSDGKALFVISDRPVSFGRLARFMRDALGCQDALYLDGTVSSLWSPDLKRLDRRGQLGTFVVVLRPAATAP